MHARIVRLRFQMNNQSKYCWHICAVSAAIGFSAGCSQDARLADKVIPDDVQVRTVSHYGLTLDQNATPEQVTFVLLNAIRDDFLASTPDERKKALDVQFDVSAANEIRKINAFGRTPREQLYRVVYHWTPVVAYYVQDIDTDWEKAKARFRKQKPQKTKQGIEGCRVFLELADPSGTPNARVVLNTVLVKDSGYWRVRTLSFVPGARTLKPRVASKPASKEQTDNS